MAIEAVGLLTTKYEEQARRVLGWLNGDQELLNLLGLHRDDIGFVYAEGRYEVIIKANMDEEIARRLHNQAFSIANTDLKPAALQTFNQFERM
jgi:hypothetical protein